MKRNFFCPSCGNREANRLFLTNQNGKTLSLMLSSQSTIRKSTGEVCCEKCKHVGKLVDFNVPAR